MDMHSSAQANSPRYCSASSDSGRASIAYADTPLLLADQLQVQVAVAMENIRQSMQLDRIASITKRIFD